MKTNSKKYHCKVCKKTIKPFLSLGKMPLVNSFLKEAQFKKEAGYDLTVGFCPACYTVQLIETVSPEKLYTKYIYLSSVLQASKSFSNHGKKTAQYLSKRFKLNKKSLVVEAASNDGTELQYFKNLDIPVLGIDPAKNIAAIANKKGIKTIPAFFGAKIANELVKKKIQADLLLGINVLAHVPNINNFVSGVKIILKKRGTAVFEFPYLKGLFENKFDIIYHEHVFYYSLISLINIFKQAGLDIYDVEHVKMQGGSLRIFVSHKGVFSIKKSISRLIKQEDDMGFKKIETYLSIAQNIESLKEATVTLLKELKGKGYRIAGYSAPAKGNILLNYFDIKENYLDYLVDISETKIGFYTPGTHMLVYPEEKIFNDRPDYALILCWNYIDDVLKRLKKLHDQGTKFIIPIPKLKII